MVGAGTFRGEQQEHEVNRLAVHGLEIDRALQPREQAEQLVELGQLAMGNGDAIADRGGAKFLALQQDLEDRALVLAGQLGGFAASSCNACFLLLTFNAGRIASGATRSVIVIGRSEVN